MSVRMRANRGHTGNRRSHHGLGEPRLTKCADCGELHVRHRVCENCGKYRSRAMIDTAAKLAKRERKAKSREREMRESGQETRSKEPTDESEPKEVRPLDAEELSRKS